MKRQLKNLSSLLASDAGNRLIGFFVTAYLARMLGPSGFGVLSIGLAVLGHLAILGSSGMQVIETRNVAAQPGGLHERVGSVLVVRLTISTVLFAVTWFVSGAIGLSEPMRDVVRLYAFSLIPYAVLLDWFFQGKEEFFLLGLARFLMYLVFGLCVLALVRGAGDLRMAPVAFALGNCFAALFLGFAYWKHARRPPFAWSPSLWPTIVLDNLPVGLALLLAQLVSNFPPLVVGFFLAEEDVGMYSAALKLVFFVLILDRLFNAVFLPVATRYFAKGGEEVPFLLRTTLKGMLILVLPIAVGGVLLAPVAISLVFGLGYAGAIPLLRVMMGFFMLTMVNSIFVCVLVASGRERLYTWSMLRGTGVLVIAVIALTPLAGTQGASWALLIGEGTTLALMMHNARKAIPLPSASILIRPLTGCALMIAVFWALGPINLIAACAAGIVVYAIPIIAGSAMTKEEFHFLRERFV